MLLHTTGYLPNEILNASYNYSKHETDLLLMLVDLYAGKPDLVISIAALTANWGETNKKHEELRKAFINLQSKPLEYFDKKTETYIIAAIVIESKIDTVRKLVTVKFSDKIGEILTKAKAHFTRYNFEVLLNLESRYSKRLYLHCNAFKKTGYWTIEIDNLRKALRLENKYEQTFDFKKKILAPSFKEISEKSELDLVINYQSTGKKIHTMNVSIEIKPEYIKKLEQPSMHWNTLIEFGLDQWQASNVCKVLDDASIAGTLNYLRMNRHSIRNAGGYLRSCFIELGVPMDRKI
jgi:plasmid replication initiation protein